MRESELKVGGMPPSPSELPDYTPSLYVFSRERERKKGVNRIE